MADTSLFSRLQRLFSSDVIIRNIGGKQLKVMDTARIQKYGNLATNSLYDRFTRLHRPVGSSLQYNPTLNYQSMRLQLYSDYEAMDHDPIIAAALGNWRKHDTPIFTNQISKKQAGWTQDLGDKGQQDLTWLLD